MGDVINVNFDQERYDNLTEALDRANAVMDAALDETNDASDDRVQLARALASVTVVVGALAELAGLREAWAGQGLPVDPDAD